MDRDAANPTKTSRIKMLFMLGLQAFFVKLITLLGNKLFICFKIKTSDTLSLVNKCPANSGGWLIYQQRLSTVFGAWRMLEINAESVHEQ